MASSVFSSISVTVPTKTHWAAMVRSALLGRISWKACAGFEAATRQANITIARMGHFFGLNTDFWKRKFAPGPASQSWKAF